MTSCFVNPKHKPTWLQPARLAIASWAAVIAVGDHAGSIRVTNAIAVAPAFIDSDAVGTHRHFRLRCSILGIQYCTDSPLACLDKVIRSTSSSVVCYILNQSSITALVWCLIWPLSIR